MPPRLILNVCRAALAIGPLRIERVRWTTHWRFGRRMFSNETVLRLIESGEAVRRGDLIEATHV